MALRMRRLKSDAKSMLSVLSVLLVVLQIVCLSCATEQNNKPKCKNNEACRLIDNSATADVGNTDRGSGDAMETTTEIESRDSKNDQSEQHELCTCPYNGGCPGQNETDSVYEVKIDAFTSMHLCVPKDKLRVCNDFRNPSLRLFKQLKPPDMTAEYVKTQIWCRCESGHYERLPKLETWSHGHVHVTSYVCTRY